MPSPTDSTVPTSETSASVPKPAIWSRMTLEISAARMSILSPSRRRLRRHAFHSRSESVEFGADRAVDLLRADLHDQASEDGRVDGEVDRDVAADAALEVGPKRRDLAVVERPCGDDLRGRLAAMGGGQQVEEADDRGELGQPPVLGEDAEEVRRDR